MTADLPLFAPETIRRNADPVTSHRAAAEVTRSGRRARQANQVLALITSHPGADVSELVRYAADMGLALDRASISKRLSDLHAAKKIRVVSDAGRARRWVAA